MFFNQFWSIHTFDSNLSSVVICISLTRQAIIIPREVLPLPCWSLKMQGTLAGTFFKMSETIFCIPGYYSCYIIKTVFIISNLLPVIISKQNSGGALSSITGILFDSNPSNPDSLICWYSSCRLFISSGLTSTSSDSLSKGFSAKARS